MTRTDIVHFPRERYQRPGVYRRRLRVQTGPGWSHAAMEDDPHHYALELRHDGTQVTAITAQAIRTPWTTCADATRPLQRLVGMVLSPDLQQVWRHANGREQCTHLFDLAGLAVAHAAREIACRDYEAEVPCQDPGARRDAVLRVDGAEALRWTLQRNLVVAPEPFAGQDVAAMSAWAKQRFVDRDRLQAVLLLRRAVFVAGHRFFDLDRMQRASETGHVGDACYVFRDGVAEHALRVPGATREFRHGGELLADDGGAAVGAAADPIAPAVAQPPVGAQVASDVSASAPVPAGIAR